VRQANTFPGDLRNDLTQQAWFMMTADIRRLKGHPAPFPLLLPARLIALYTVPGDLVLDPFVGTGTTCVAAKTLDRRWLGIDINPEFLEMAARRIAEAVAPPELSTGERSKALQGEVLVHATGGLITDQ
jgi:modification methylase